MKYTDFCHLHVHTDFSLLDGACGVKNLVKAAHKLGQKALAITDHGNLYGVIPFYEAAKSHGVKPIIGYEAYLAPGSRKQKDAKGISEAAWHLTLLAMNRAGYHNLIRLSTAAFIEGFYYRPRIDMEILSQHSEGLVCLTGCLSSELSSHLGGGNAREIQRHLARLVEIFGRDRLFIEVQNHGLAEQERMLPDALKLAAEMNIAAAATNDVHYVARDDAEAHDALLCISTGKLVSDPNRMRMKGSEFYLKSADEMLAAVGGNEELLINTARIAAMCDVSISERERHEPQYAPPRGKSCREYLRELAEAGLARRFGEVSATARERLEYELGVIDRTGYDSYYLVVWDFVHFAKSREIMVGPGRGSGCGSLVAYVLEITDIDPLKYDILFERFLDEQRKSAPDFDIDFDPDGREEVIEYVRSKYGAENMAQIVTFGTMAVRGVLRDVGRVLGIPLAKVDPIAKLVPSELHITLKDALEKEPELARMAESDREVRKLFDIAFRLEGLHRHASIHAAGVVIADKPLVNYVPLCRVGDSIATQYTMDHLEKVGLVKMDFLGLRTLTHLKKTVANVRATSGAEIDLPKLLLDDRATYELLSSGNSLGIFQCESAGFRDLLVKLKPDTFGDIVALVALYRPGPLGGGMVEDFVNRKRGKDAIHYQHKILEGILHDTYGVMVYQDQVMMILNRMGGVPMSQAYDLIKAISKKKVDTILAARDDFVSGAEKNGVPRRLAEEIFQLIEHFGGYGFNKSHSSAYALIAYQTAYLKAHYPREFLAAYMTTEMSNSDKVVEGIEECRRLGLRVLAPDVNFSGADFTVVGEDIRFGLGAIKGIGLKAIAAIVEARGNGGPFRDLFDLAERVDLRHANRAVFDGLIKAGALDCFGAARSRLEAAGDAALAAGSRAQQDVRGGQMSLFGQAAAGPSAPPPALAVIPEWAEQKLLAGEKEALGFYLSRHPLTSHAAKIDEFSTAHTSDLARMEAGREVTVGGLVNAVKMKRTQRGRLAIVSFEDLQGSVEVVVFDDDIERLKPLMEPGRIVFVRGQVSVRPSGEPNLRALEVVPMEQACELLTRSVVIRLASGQTEDEKLQRLRAVLTSHPGKCPVFFDVPDEEGRRFLVRAGNGLFVGPGEQLVRDVDALLGAGRARLVGPQRPANGNGNGRGANHFLKSANGLKSADGR